MARMTARPYKDEVEKVLGLLISGKPLIMYDLETTGLSSLTSKILTCSAIKFKYENGMFHEIDRLDQYINPGFPIPEEASKVNNITDEDVKDSPDEWTACEEIIRPFFGDNPVIGGYNILGFDNKFMEAMYLRSTGYEFKPEAVLDVFMMVKEKMNLKSATLENAATELAANVGIKFHTSIDDVMVTQRVMELLIPLYYDAVEPAKFRFKVYGCFYQKYSHKNERIYIHTYPKSKSYYDVYRKEWCSDCIDGFNLEDLKKDTLKLMGVNDEKELLNLVKEKDNNGENYEK